MVKIKVIESQRKVVATLDDCSRDAYNIICKELPPFLHFSYDRVKMRNTFKACAVCHPDDDFDVEVGIALAKQRVLDKYHKNLKSILKSVSEEVDNWVESYCFRYE